MIEMMKLWVEQMFINQPQCYRVKCKWRPTTAGFAELNGRDAELSGHF